LGLGDPEAGGSSQFRVCRYSLVFHHRYLLLRHYGAYSDDVYNEVVGVFAVSGALLATMAGREALAPPFTAYRDLCRGLSDPTQDRGEPDEIVVQHVLFAGENLLQVGPLVGELSEG